MLIEIGDIELERTQFRGVKAMFARRMLNFQQLLAVDIVIPLQAIPVDGAEFCRTVNQFRLRHLQNDAQAELL